MSCLQLGDIAPNFKADTTIGEIDFHDYLGDSWGILFSHPADFTPVCTTELGRTAQLKQDFERRNTKVLVVSVDSVKDHHAWKADIDETQKTTVEFPIIGDEGRKVSNLYGMLHPKASETVTVRSLFIIDPDKKIRLMITYPSSTGRNFDEVLRVLDSLQLTDKHQIATPADWNPGENVIVSPAIATADAEKMFEKGVIEIKPYLRYTPMPE